MKKTIYNLKGVTNATFQTLFPCELKRILIWVDGRNPINGNVGSSRKRWVFVNNETGKNHFPCNSNSNRDNTFDTKKQALEIIKRRGDI